MSLLVPHLYIHLPFCHEKCRYCDFATSTLPIDAGEHESKFETYLAALKTDLIEAIKFFGPQTFSTIYFGGGTPSVWPPALLEELLDFIKILNEVSDNLEISIECNPNSLNAEKLDAYERLGVTRVSLGVQSLTQKSFESLGRIHTIEQSRAALSLLQKNWKRSWSADLMFGLPDQTFADFKNDLSEILSYAPPHISAYGLILEKSTPFGKTFKTGQSPLPSDDDEADMYEHLLSELPKHGFLAYELSNFAQPGHESRHNQAYWNGANYLAIGLSAAGHVEGQRFAHNTRLERYLKNPAHDYARLLSRKIPWKKRLAEKIFLMLRTSEGLDLSRLSELERDHFRRHGHKKMQRWLETGHLLEQISGQRWVLTPKGQMLSSSVMADLMDT